MVDLKKTPGYRAVVKRISEPYARASSYLFLRYYSTLFILPAEIGEFRHLKLLSLRASPVADLSPIARLTSLEELDLGRTRVTDLSALAEMTAMQDAVMRGQGGLSYEGTPIAKAAPFDRLVELNQPFRTVETINEVRRRCGLKEHIPTGYAELDKGNELTVQPLKGVLAPFDFHAIDGSIKLASNSIDWPIFPFPTSERDHDSRLETSRTLAVDLASELEDGRFNARPDYAASLSKYANRLPKKRGEGNILLADAEARSIRSMFAAEADILPIGLASKLKTILEQHIGLRVYYPEIEHFYRDVQNGRIESPLPLDAAQEFIRGVDQYTPVVFAPEVQEALGTSTSQSPEGVPVPTTVVLSPEGDQPRAPPDPLGNLNPRKARDYAFAGTVNSIWKAFREGEAVYRAVEGWRNAGKALEPYVHQILDWLSRYGGHGN
ncbi:leucine-rich repeat domain-containing protein [Bradyrhizobium iriomotense]|uniref:leucine-rich repeat domain-containing protein n=1 Tax=Bradyrhizobium iriomotense TaxID=441950 RepID=UPI001B89DFEA|nr:leucine-rich repeat domain-containing protein [Bradyrhizobium iriomotense]MBR1130649.1 hypothetical protein [Bradyrhizobium iriomotense]